MQVIAMVSGEQRVSICALLMHSGGLQTFATPSLCFLTVFSEHCQKTKSFTSLKASMRISVSDGESKPLSLPWCVSESELENNNGVYWRKPHEPGHSCFGLTELDLVIDPGYRNPTFVQFIFIFFLRENKCNSNVKLNVEKLLNIS